MERSRSAVVRGSQRHRSVAAGHTILLPTRSCDRLQQLSLGARDGLMRGGLNLVYCPQSTTYFMVTGEIRNEELRNP